MSRDVQYIFPTPIAFAELNENMCQYYASEVMHYVNEQQLAQTHWETTHSHLNELPEFETLVKVIDDEVKYYATEIFGLADDSLMLTSMWSNVHTNGSHHFVHTHPNSYISGVLYLEVPEDPGKIAFRDPRVAKNMQFGIHTKHTCMSHQGVLYTPTLGMLILFPSWLEHGTEPFKSNSRRISLSFNYMLSRSDTKSSRFDIRK